MDETEVKKENKYAWMSLANTGLEVAGQIFGGGNNATPPPPSQQSSSNTIWWIVGGVGLTIIVVIIAIKLKK